MWEIQYHCYGTSEGSRRKQVARENLKKIFYKNETNCIFDNSFKTLKGVFNVLEKYCVPLYKEKMVEHLLDQIMSPNT